MDITYYYIITGVALPLARFFCDLTEHERRVEHMLWIYSSVSSNFQLDKEGVYTKKTQNFDDPSPMRHSGEGEVFVMF
jgi:hypothetical protein